MRIVFSKEKGTIYGQSFTKQSSLFQNNIKKQKTD